MPGPSLGTNLSSITDWSTSFPFVDLFQGSRPWFTQSGNTFDTGQAGMLDLDAAGWVKGFTKDDGPAPFDRVSTIINTSGIPFRDGLYVIDWEGEGEIAVSGARIVERGDGRIVVDPGDGPVGISILSTDPAGTGDHLRDIRFFHSDDADLLAAGVVFDPAFLARIEDFRVLRFMDWMGTNNAEVNPIAEVLREDAARHSVYGDEGAGASIEVMVALANETQADPWFTIPHGASAAWIRTFATYVRDHLDEGLVARFEYSNEVWNWGFEQARWAQGEAVKEWGGGVQGGWMQMYGVKAAEMARVVQEVFGSETGTRALNVFATQAGWPGLEDWALDAPDHVADGGLAPRDAPFHVYAIAPYFGGSLGSVEMTSRVNGWIAQGEAGIRAALAWIASGPTGDSVTGLVSTIAHHAAMAEGLGWQLEGYEGGQHVVDLAGLFGGGEDPRRTAFFTAIAARPEMRALYEDYLEMWKDGGGGLMAQFSDFGMPSRYGSWGLWDSPWGPDTPRSLAVEAFRDGTAAWWGDDRPASAFEGLHTLVDREGTGRLVGGNGTDRIFGLGGNDRLEGGAGTDALHGGDGGDTLLGQAHDDHLDGGAGADSLHGGDGADLLLGQAGNDLLDGGAGSDALHGGDGTDRLLGLGGHDVLDGAGGNDNLSGGDGNDRLEGGQGNDFLELDRGDDRIDGGEGADCLRVDGTVGVTIDLALTGPQATGLGLDTILNMEHVYGSAGDDVILGTAATNVLRGLGGDDELRGRSGTDVLSGGGGSDVLSGGRDGARDVFVFNAPGATRMGVERDTITDFERGIDDVDLRGIDANAALAGDQAFRLVAGPAAGGVWAVSSGSTLMLRGDANGDGVADFEIQMNGLSGLDAGDLLL